MNISGTSYNAFNFFTNTSSAENRKGANAVHQCSIENQKGPITLLFVQQ